MRVLALTLIRNDDFALIRLNMYTFLTIVKVKNDPLCLTVITFKKKDGNILSPLSYHRI